MLMAVKYCDNHPDIIMKFLQLVTHESKNECSIEPLSYCPKCKVAHRYKEKIMSINSTDFPKMAKGKMKGKMKVSPPKNKKKYIPASAVKKITGRNK